MWCMGATKHYARALLNQWDECANWGVAFIGMFHSSEFLRLILTSRWIPRRFLTRPLRSFRDYESPSAPKNTGQFCVQPSSVPCVLVYGCGWGVSLFLCVGGGGGGYR